MHAKSDFTLPLADASAELAWAGGKGASLRRLAAAGLPVPDGFHVTTVAYRCFVEANGLQTKILAVLKDVDATLPATLEAASASIGGLFAEAKIPPEVAAAIRDAYTALDRQSTTVNQKSAIGNRQSSIKNRKSVAVRSSATAEDLPEASFAGQQETYLNICGEEALLAAVKKCWASLWSGRAIAYRLKNNVDQETVALAVVVQEMVFADAAGVLFTVDPVSGQRDRALISASWGLGEAVVGGLVTPDSLSVEKATGRVLNRQTADKQVMTVRTDGATEEQPVSEALRRAPVLDDAAVAQLTALAVQIEQLYGQPMDIEWAWTSPPTSSPSTPVGLLKSEAGFAILQARPITALPTSVTPPPTWPKPPRGVMYGRTSFAEQMPNPVSPLFATFGLRMADIPTQELMRRFTKAKVNYAYVPVNGYVYMVAGLSFLELVAYARMTGQITSMVLHAQEHCPAARQAFVQVIRDWEARDIACLSPSELLTGAGTVFQESVRLYTHLQAGTVPLSTISESCFTQFYNRLARRKGDPAAATFLLGSETVTLRAEKALFDLAAWCRERPALADYLRRTPADQIAQVLAQPQPPADLSPEDWAAWQTQFRAYLTEHGQMTYDLDFANPVPAEQPSALLETVKMYLQGGGSNPYARQQASLARRKQATEAILARLHWPLRGWFQRLLRWAQNAAPGREDSLADLGLGHPLIRRYLNELGRRLAEGGAFPEAESIYWLEESEVHELIAALESGRPLPDMSSLIPARRAEWQRYLKLIPPAILPEKSGWSALVPWQRTNDERSTLHGVGASSGRVTAPARVIFGPEDFSRMRPGDVLVAVTTTPAWTPLFALASAVVTDIGGPLSHSSIVAREYGIPAVMAAGSATRRIQDGQTITVDGDAGVVTLPVEKASAGRTVGASSKFGYDPVTGEWNDSLRGDYCWSSINLREAAPDVMTPATWSQLWTYLNVTFPVKIPGGHPVGGNIAGRLYFNLSVISSLYHRIGLDARDEKFGDLLGSMPADLDMPYLPFSFPSMLWHVLPGIIKDATLTVRDSRQFPRYIPGLPEWCRAARSKIEGCTDAAGLLALWNESIWPARLRNLRMLRSITGLLSEPATKLKLELTARVGEQEANTLLSNLSGEAGDLESLGPLVGLAKVKDGRMSREEYVKRYGHRGPHEVELSAPDASDDPDWLEKKLADFTRSGVDVEALLARQRAESSAAWQRFEVHFTDKAGTFRRKLEQVAAAAKDREAIRSASTRMSRGVIRPFYLQAGKVTGIGSEVFFLMVDELATLLAGDKLPLDVIPARREMYTRYCALPPYPAIIYGRFDPFQWAADSNRRSDVYDDRGTGAAFPSTAIKGYTGAAGRVEGFVRRIERVEDGDQIRPGEILVTTCTNIGWTPLFPRLAAVVTDIGAPLSHAAIVAREMGIPAVVGCSNATSLLKTGDHVRVDGGKGTVEFLDR